MCPQEPHSHMVLVIHVGIHHDFLKIIRRVPQPPKGQLHQRVQKVSGRVVTLSSVRSGWSFLVSGVLPVAWRLQIVW